MQIGIMTRTFPRSSLGETLDAVTQHGIRAVQSDLADAGLGTLPEEIPDTVADAFRTEMEERGITMAAISGTFNMIHPDPDHRTAGLRRLKTLAAACPRLGTQVITLCTGTRNPDSMWRRHPDNDTEAAWSDLLVSMRTAMQIATEHDVVLAFEPEVANVVDSAQKARRLLDEIGSPHLKVVMDGANIFHAGELPRMQSILSEAFRLLGNDIALAHAKDLDRDGEAGHLAAGYGLLDYDLYIRLLRESGYTGAVVLHGLREDQVAACTGFLHDKGVA